MHGLPYDRRVCKCVSLSVPCQVSAIAYQAPGNRHPYSCTAGHCCCTPTGYRVPTSSSMFRRKREHDFKFKHSASIFHPVCISPVLDWSCSLGAIETSRFAKTLVNLPAMGNPRYIETESGRHMLTTPHTSIICSTEFKKVLLMDSTPWRGFFLRG